MEQRCRLLGAFGFACVDVGGCALWRRRRCVFIRAAAAAVVVVAAAAAGTPEVILSLRQPKPTRKAYANRMFSSLHFTDGNVLLILRRLN